MADYVTATNGQQLDIPSLEQTLVFAGGFLSTVTVTLNSINYIQTLTNDGTTITNISQWVNQ